MWVRALKAKYFPHTSFMKSKKKRACSWLWNGVLKIKPLLARDLYFKVGRGDSVKFQEDPWIPSLPSYIPKPRNSANSSFGMVCSLKLSNGKWDKNWLESFFDQASAKRIKEMFQAKNDLQDKLI